MTQNLVQTLPLRMTAGMSKGDFYFRRSVTSINTAGGAQAQYTITVGTLVASTAYSFTINGITIIVNSGALSATAYAAAVVSAIRNSRLIYNDVTVSSSTNVITILGPTSPIYSAVSIVVGSPSVFTLATVTAAANPSVIRYGNFAVTKNTADYAPNGNGRQPASALTATGDLIRGVVRASQDYEKVIDPVTGQYVGGVQINQVFELSQVDEIVIECDAPIAFTTGTAPTLYARFAAFGSLVKTGTLSATSDAGTRAFGAGESVTLVSPTTTIADGTYLAWARINFN